MEGGLNMENDDWDVEKLEDADDEIESTVYQISNYPADITLRGYLDKNKTEQLVIPEFQRNYVWDQRKASKLIESFLLGLPVPGVFLYKVRNSNKLSIVDGQQRIMSAIRFFNNRFDEKIFRLTNVHSKWNNKTYDELDEGDRYLLDDTVLRATVIQQLDPADDSSIYRIFERLNTGGINLNAMEIRRCVYYGEFIGFLERLNENSSWRIILSKPLLDKRLRDTELVLRLISLQYRWNAYEKPMKTFLNSFVSHVNRMSDSDRVSFLARVEADFSRTVDAIVQHFGEKPFHIRGPMNYAVLDSVFSAVASLDVIPDDIGERYLALLSDSSYIAAATINTSDSKTLMLRFTKAFKYIRG